MAEQTRPPIEDTKSSAKLQLYNLSTVAVAMPMQKGVYASTYKGLGWIPYIDAEELEEGFLVIYPNGTNSWLKKADFLAIAKLISSDELNLINSI